MAQQLQELCDALVQKHVDGKMHSESEHLLLRYTQAADTLAQRTKTSDLCLESPCFLFSFARNRFVADSSLEQSSFVAGAAQCWR